MWSKHSIFQSRNTALRPEFITESIIVTRLGDDAAFTMELSSDENERVQIAFVLSRHL